MVIIWELSWPTDDLKDGFIDDYMAAEQTLNESAITRNLFIIVSTYSLLLERQQMEEDRALELKSRS